MIIFTENSEFKPHRALSQARDFEKQCLLGFRLSMRNMPLRACETSTMMDRSDLVGQQREDLRDGVEGSEENTTKLLSVSP